MSVHGQVKPSSIENSIYDPDINATRNVEVPSNLQQRVAYNASNQAEYVGFGARGLASSDTGWLIQKFTYSSGLVTLRQIAYDSWDNRASATYA